MIEVQDLTKSYGSDLRAIDALTFKVNKGEVVGFLGPNGAGKSTTMKIITGFMAPTSGTAAIAGFDVFESPLEVKKRIGYLPENPPVYGDMRVSDYLAFVAELKGVPTNQVKKNVDLALEKTNLTAVSKRLIQNLSKGFRQRVGIAQALVSNPEVLILDEPTVGLDPKQVAEIRDLIRELRGHHTLILSTHILPEVEAVCERIIIINKGRIVAQDTLENLSHLQKGQRRIQLAVRKSSADLLSQLQSVPGVVRLIEKDRNHFSIETQDQDGILDSVAEVVLKQKAGLLELSSAQADLEDIFIKLTYEQGKV